MDLDHLSKLIDANRGVNVEFGDSMNSPSDAWIKKAEAHLGIKFPSSYVWFLKNYGGGEIHGDEIFSIYQIPFDEALGGDVVYRTMLDRKNGFVKDCEITICSTDFGELFLMDSSREDEGGEYPIVRKTGTERQDFASNFAEFIEKFIGNASVS